MVNFYRQVILRYIHCFLLTGLFVLAGERECIAQLAGSGYTINKAAAASPSNFQSFQSFFTKLATDGVGGAVIVEVLNGPYTEQVKANPIAGVNSINTVTIKGNGNRLIYNYTGTNPVDAYTLQFSGADYVIIKNLVIEELGAATGWGVHFTNSSDNNTLEDCTVKMNTTNFNQNSAGIVVAPSLSNITTAGTAAANLTIQGCNITGTTAGAPWNGIYLNPQSTGTVASNIIIKYCNIESFRESGISMTNCRGVKITGNRISRPVLQGVNHSNGIVISNTSREDIIEGNRIYDCFKSVLSSSLFVSFRGINIQNAIDVSVINNMIYQNNNKDEWIGIYFTCSPGIKISHNTITNNNAFNTNDPVYGLYHENSCASTGAVFTNNIVSIQSAGSGPHYAIFQDGPAIYTNYNNLFVGGGGNSYIGYAASQKWQSLADWQSVSGAPGAPYDQNSVSEPPKFSNLASGNLTPENIMIDGVGIPTSVSTDINGVNRDPNTPDPGAVEFNIDANVSKIIMNGPAGCQGNRDTVKIRITNKSTVDLSGFEVSYTVNSLTPVVELFTGLLKAGDSVLFVFSKPIEFKTPGAYIVTTRVGVKPNVGPYSITIASSPVGGQLKMGSPFKGKFASGISADPDVVASPDSLVYELTEPPGFSNSLYGTSWVINRIYLEVVGGGGSIGSTDTAWVSPVITGGNGMLRFKAPAGLTGKNIILGVVPYSIANKCEAPSVTREIYISPRPKAIFSQADVCDKMAMQFTNASAINKGTLHYLWKFGDGDTSNDIHPLKTYGKAGSYTVTLLAISDQGYIDSVTKVVAVLKNPEPDFSYNNRCEGIAITFNDKSVIANGSPLYSWVFGDGLGGSTQINPTYLYNSPNIYFVSLTIVDALGCRATTTKPVTFSKSPVANFSFPSLTCNQKKVQFTNNSIPTSPLTGYVWDFGDGKVATGKHVDHVYDMAGNYDVMLYARNQFDCVDSMVKTITLTETPAIAYTLSSQCAQTPVQFINTTTGPAGDTVHYLWELPNNVVDTRKSFTYTFGSIGEYDIVLTAYTDKCTAQMARKFVFSEKPFAEFSMRQNACIGDVISMSNGSFLSNKEDTLWFNWYFDNGTKSTQQNPDIVFNSQGPHIVKLVASSGIGCSDSVERSITVYPVPNSDFLIESAGYGDGSMKFTPIVQNGSGKYFWQYGDGQSSDTAESHIIKYNSSGKVEIILRISNSGCASTTKKSVYINPLSFDEIPHENFSVSVYPMPASTSISVECNNAVQGLEIYNSTGQQVLIETPVDDLPQGVPFTLPVETLKPGIYYLKVYTRFGSNTTKFAISR